jgi:hypothetical protein
LALGGRGGRQCVGAVPRVVKAAPAGVGGVEDEAFVERRHDQLRTGEDGDLAIDFGGADVELARLGNEVADLLEERAILGAVVRLAAPFAVPGVDLRLERVTLGQELAVAGDEPLAQRRKPGPERCGIAS